MKNQDISRGRHCVFALHVHLVFVTKYRYRVFDGDAINRLRLLFSKVCVDFESELVQIDGEDHHVYLLVKYPPKVAISNLVNSLKGVSSHMLRQNDPTWLLAIGKACSGRHRTSPPAVVGHL